MNNPNFTLYFDLEPDADAGQIAQELQNGLQRLENVETAVTVPSPSTSRVTGLEILVAITLAAQIVHQAREISDDLHAIVGNLKTAFARISALAKELKVKNVFIPVDGERKPIQALGEKDYQAIAEDMSAADNT